MQRTDPQHPCPLDPARLVEDHFVLERRALLLGPSGSGKTTLARSLAGTLGALGRAVRCLGADPGLPGFGVPGALCLAEWEGGGWAVRQIEALCTLDAARFRLPLVAAARTLADRVGAGNLLVDAPGVVRGVAGAELLEALVRAARVDLILVLHRPGQAAPLAGELQALGSEIVWVRPSEQARRPGPASRSRQRTGLWDGYLEGGGVHTLALDTLQLLGTPPRRAGEAWRGKQVAFLRDGRTETMGEVLGFDGSRLEVRLPRRQAPAPTLLVRDACRDSAGQLVTGAPFAADLVHYVPPPDLVADEAVGSPTGTRPVVRLDAGVACLINGVFGDPLLHLRLGHQRRSLLFDLGDGSRLPARIAHQVTDVFVTHAHADHICGFLWLLRSRIGETGVCRLYGPPGLAGHIGGLVDGILWDRIGDRGPVFDVWELHGGQLRGARLRAGAPEALTLGEREVEDGLLLAEPGFRVRCTQLDHGTPVLAFAYESTQRVNVRKERLAERGLEPGPWLTGLKQRILAGDFAAEVPLPDGRRETVAGLAADLTLSGPGSRLVYATDFADSPDNRRALAVLAAGAECLFCEASFLSRDRDQAARTGHLTARACGEIASAADVRVLIPFHFSRRYEHEPWSIYGEIAAVCPRVALPKGRQAPDGS